MFRVGALSVAVSLLLLVSCMAPDTAKMASVSPRSWSEPASVVVENVDTLSLRRISIAVRYNSDFDGTMLPLAIKVLAPDGRVFEEEQSFPLRQSGGATVVSVSESLPYRDDVLLSTSGKYMFVFEPRAEVRGVEAIGVEILNKNGKR